MKHRQNRETAAKKKSVFGIVLLVIAFALFCGSAISFCWAISNAKDAQNNTNAEVSNAGSSEEDDNDEAESVANSTEESQSLIDEQNSTKIDESENTEAKDNDTSNKVSSANNNDEEVAGSIKLDAKDLSDSSESKKNDKKSKSKRTAKGKSKAKSNAYHTAYWKEPIYKEAKHYAAKQRLITINNETIIEWTYCKTCGKSHKKSYTDKILDHYEEHFCEVCGKKHKHGYLE